MYKKGSTNNTTTGRQPKELTKEQVLLKLTALCARSEHCRYEMQEKMRRWGVAEAVQGEVVAYLEKEKYIDEARFARFFINDKVKYNKWGRRKVEQALYAKHISPEVSRPILDELVEEQDYTEMLENLLRTKLRTVTGRNAYEVRGKLIRFALSRGFSYDVIEKCVDKLDIDD